MNDLASRIDEYLASEFRRYFPDCSNVTVNQRADEIIDVTVSWDDNELLYRMEIGSDDDFYVFDCSEMQSTITVPFPDFLLDDGDAVGQMMGRNV